MGTKTPREIRLKRSIYGTLMFYILSSPSFYNFTANIFGNNSMCPSNSQIIAHSFLYLIALHRPEFNMKQDN